MTLNDSWRRSSRNKGVGEYISRIVMNASTLSLSLSLSLSVRVSKQYWEASRLMVGFSYILSEFLIVSRVPFIFLWSRTSWISVYFIKVTFQLNFLLFYCSHVSLNFQSRVHWVSKPILKLPKFTWVFFQFCIINLFDSYSHWYCLYSLWSCDLCGVRFFLSFSHLLKILCLILNQKVEEGNYCY